METNGNPHPAVLQGTRKYVMMAYNVVLALVLSSWLIYSVAFSPYCESQGAESVPPPSTAPTAGPTAQATPGQNPQLTPVISPTAVISPTPVSAAQSTASSLISCREETPLIPNILLATILTMVAAGGAGAALCNLRGLFRYAYLKGGLPCDYEQAYYLRPFIGMVTGLLIFLIGYLLTSALSDVATLSWATLPGRLPYIGLAVLAGFAAQEFTERMKAVAETFFSQTTLSVDEQLRRLKQLKDEGLITEDQYNLKRQALVDKL